MTVFQFVAGQPACPVGCQYCFITEHDARRAMWNTNPLAGINKASTFINVPPWIPDSPADQERFYNFPFHLLEGDFVGFTAITDPFWPKLERYLWHFLDTVAPLAKLVTCVSKWPIGRKTMRRLAQYENFRLVLGVTGNWSIEKVSLAKHLETLALAKELGVPVLPISHPYIAGVSDLSFLPQVKALGYDGFDVKGLRYDGTHMGIWMPETSKPYYEGREDQEVLPEDGWRERVADAGLTLLSPRQWYIREGSGRGPNLDRVTAERCVTQIMTLANVASSGTSNEVWEAAIARRL